ncbi:IS5 family transposase [Acidisphaera rubrifaciens]|uniref:IS5 family transposase n=1 Tax=Acidisphaera rubrifaciens TaxID=50715 RepID=UPI0035A24A98
MALIRGLLTDEEWGFFKPFLTENRSRGGRPPADHRRVLDAILWITRTGATWRDLPSERGNWNSVFRQYRRWTEAAVWDVMLAALVESEASDNTLQMIDSTIVRAHQHAAGGRGRFTTVVLTVRAVASRPKSIHVRTRTGSASASA